MRGIAALMIVALHCNDQAFAAKPLYPLRIGVDIFFVISGFVMVYASRHLFGKAGGWKEFISRRLIRIVPLYWFYTTLAVIVALAAPHMMDTAKLEPMKLLLSYLFIPTQRAAGEIQPFLALGWTLNYEMYFYVVFAALLFLPMKKMLLALSAFFIGVTLTGIFIPFEWHALYFWTRPQVLEFVGGAWVAYAYLKGFRIPSYSLIGLPILAIGLAYLNHLPADLGVWAMETAAILSIALIILPKNMEYAAVPVWLLDLGDASYTIYLSHPFIFKTIAKTAKFIKLWPLWGLCVLGSLIAGYILYLFIEKPLLSATKKVFSRHEKAV